MLVRSNLNAETLAVQEEESNVAKIIGRLIRRREGGGGHHWIIIIASHRTSKTPFARGSVSTRASRMPG